MLDCTGKETQYLMARYFYDCTYILFIDRIILMIKHHKYLPIV